MKDPGGQEAGTPFPDAAFSDVAVDAGAMNVPEGGGEGEGAFDGDHRAAFDITPDGEELIIEIGNVLIRRVNAPAGPPKGGGHGIEGGIPHGV